MYVTYGVDRGKVIFLYIPYMPILFSYLESRICDANLTADTKLVRGIHVSMFCFDSTGTIRHSAFRIGDQSGCAICLRLASDYYN